MANLFLDIETVSQNEKPPLDSIKVPANYKKTETIAEYQKEHQDEAWRRQALDSMQGRIICIGWAIDDEPIGILSSLNECDLILEFSTIISLFKETPNFIGWNIQTFDLPWLWRKAIQHHNTSLRRFIPKDNRHLICDLMRIWATDPYRDYVSLADCADFLGIKHGDVNGADIHDLWQAGNLEEIREHCRQDIETTRKIYNRIFN